MNRQLIIILLLKTCLSIAMESSAQNSLVGDGFGGRSWYVPSNYHAGAYSAFAVCNTNNQLYGWGCNVHGELGNNTIVSSNIPILASGITDVKFCTAGYLSAAIKTDNSLWVWGAGEDSLYGMHSGFSLTGVPIMSDVKFVDAGYNHFVFVKNDGTVWGIGQNSYGQLGNGATSASLNPLTTPVQMAGINNAIRAVALGRSSSDSNFWYTGASLILLNDGTVKLTGGYNWFTTTNSTIPVTLQGLNNIIDIKGNTVAAYLLNSSGEVFSFGREISPLSPGFAGSLGLGTYTGLVTAPTKIIFPIGSAPIIALSSNNDGCFALALDENGNVYGWGANGYGQLGDGTNVSRTTPVLVATNVIDILAGELFSYIIKSDYSLWATGVSRSFYIGDSASIWMNLPDVPRNSYAQINPLIAPMNLCAPESYVLSVQLFNFSGYAEGNLVKLFWESGDEINCNKYIIEYSKDGVHFQNIGSVNAKGFNSNYNFVHQNVSSTVFYRLRMLDLDGTFEYSEILKISLRPSKNLRVYPNPTQENIVIRNTSIDNIPKLKIIEFISIEGKIIKTITNYTIGQVISIGDLPSGTYILKTVSFKNKLEYLKVLKM